MDDLTLTSVTEEMAGEFGARLVTLCDGRPGLRGTLHAEISEPGTEFETERMSLPAVDGKDGVPSVPDLSSIENQKSKIVNPLAVLDFISSDDTLDRFGEIIDPRGWRLEAYARNPVFQNAHQYGDVIFTLGKALRTEVRDGRLHQRIEFAVDANPMARIAYGLYKGKFLNAVSVGFIPLRWENGDPQGKDGAFSLPLSHQMGEGPEVRALRAPHSEIRTPQFRRRYLEQELLEVSAVGIPANPNALQLGLKAGAIAKGDLQELKEWIDAIVEQRERSDGALASWSDDRTAIPASQHSATPSLQLPHPPHLPDFRSSPAAPDTHACASGVRSYEAQWLQLARDLRRVFREALGRTWEASAAPTTGSTRERLVPTKPPARTSPATRQKEQQTS